MHLYLFPRGKFAQVEEWKAHAQAAYWKWRRINLKTGKQEIILVQGALRPSVFGVYEYIFPKEALVEVCAFFGFTSYSPAVKGMSNLGVKMREITLRKIFGCKKVSKDIFEKAKKIPSTFTTADFERGCSNCLIPGVAPTFIGIKEDNMIELNGYYQEGL